MPIKRLLLWSFAFCILAGPGRAWAGGTGSVSLVPATVPEGGVVTTTLTYVVPASGLNFGGRLQISIPTGWWPSPQLNNSTQDGYVTVTSTAAATLTPVISFSTSSAVTIVVQSGSVPAATQINVSFQNVHPSCPAPNQPSAFWNVKSAASTSSVLTDLNSQPNQALVTGTAQWLGYNPQNTLTVAAGQPSAPIVIQANDNCGQPVVLSTATNVTLQGLLNNSSTSDSGAKFSLSANFTTLTSSVTIPVGASSATYYYQTSTVGNNLWIRGDYLNPAYFTNQQIWRAVNVLSGGFTFSNVAVDLGAVSSGQKSVTLSPDGSGANNFAYIRFTPSDSATQWHVVISSTNFQSFVYERWGSGDPQSSLSWDGRNYNFSGVATTAANGPQIVPNGNYAVKIEVVGLTADTSLSITVNSAQISGTVTVGGTAVNGAQVSAQGMDTPGYSLTTTDVNGHYTLNGLRSGGFHYNLYASYVNPANQSIVTGQLANVTSNSNGQNFTLTTPAVLRISAVLSTTSLSNVYGSLNVHSADYSLNYFGNLRLLAGTTTSDNGDPFTPSTWTVLYVQPGSYIIHPFIPGFGTNDITVAASADVVISLVSKANVYGVITLPSPAAAASWISVEGVLGSNNFPTAWGGASFNVGQSSAIYAVYSVDPGVYTFRARPNGYIPAAITNVTVSGTDIGNSVTGGLDFASGAFSTGGKISGTVTVNGDSSSQTNPFTLWLNAYSPALGLNLSTQVQLTPDPNSTSASYQIQGVPDGTYQIFSPYLQGFENASSGVQSIKVTNGSAALNLILNQVTGKIAGAIDLGGASDYQNVHLSLQGPYSVEKDLPAGSAAYSLKHLGTGNYTLTATYRTTGAQIQKNFLLANGQTQTINLGLNSPVYTVSGNVSVLSSFSMRNSSYTLVTINTLSDLLSNATTQTLILGGVSQNAVGGVNYQCTGGTATVVSTVRVEAFPKNFNSFGNANRSSFNNCFGVGQYIYGLVNAQGNYTIPGLTPGIWEIDVYPYFDGGQIPNASISKQVVSVVNASVSNVNFPLSNGNSISGTLSLPSGVADTRSFNAQVLSPRGDLVQSSALSVTAANSVSYQFTGLPAGSYALLIQDQGTFDQVLQQNVIKYVSKPVQFTIAGADLTGINVSMSRASSIVGKLLIQGANPDGTQALTLITPNNQNLLPSNFQIFAQADPWVPGGSGQAQWGNSGSIFIDNNNQFHISGLVAGTYDVTFQQNSYGLAQQAAGGLNIAAVTKGSVQVSESQTLDLGTITLLPGISLAGNVTDTSGNPLANIPIEADPPNNNNGQGQIRVFTDAQGNFTLAGLNPTTKIYNILAARRPSPGDTNSQPVPYGSLSKLAVDVTKVPSPSLNFALPPANSQLTGKVVTVDGGSFFYPENDRAGFPVAAIYTHVEGTVDADNPLGNSNASALDGSFAIPFLPAGTYDITIESLGYRPLKLTGISVSNGSKDLGTLTLQKGPTLNATLAKPDGSSVNTKDVNFAVAASPDLSTIIFGKIASDSNTGNITSIQFSGFELTPKTYSILFFDNQSNIITPPEGRSLVFTNNSDILTKAFTYQQSQPFALTHVLKAGASVAITYYLSRPIRNRGDDQDPTQWVSITKGNGTLSGLAVSADRKQFTVLYTPAAGEQNASLRFSVHTVDIDPSTGVEFVLTKSITLLLGQKATSEKNINPIFGGSVSLSDNSDPSSVVIPSNALLTSSGTALDNSASYAVTFTATDNASSLPSGALHGSAVAGVQTLMARGPGAYVSEAYLAMQTMVAKNQKLSSQDSSISPLSSFYSVLLPAGISHTLNQNATLTLNYDTNADPSLINAYYFNGTEYLIENNNRVVDPVNHTISVNVSHFSTFVVLQNNAPVLTVNGDNASTGDIDVFNFPNPFDLQTKTKALSHGGTTTSLTTDGTIIRYTIPAADAGPAKIDIYNVVGEKVRSIDLGIPPTGVFEYMAWDGRNDAGHKVASGVYIGVLKVGGTKKFWKMAVIK